MRSGKLATLGAALAAITGVATPAQASASFDPLPMKLPAAGAKAASASEPATWLLGSSDDAAAERIAASFGGQPVGDRAIRLASSRARDAAKALRAAGALLYAEPDVAREPASAYDSAWEQWARAAVVAPGLTAPPPGGVKIGVIDSGVDMTHPDLAGHTTPFRFPTPLGSHGTMVASAISGAVGNGGVMGVWPGAPTLSWPSDLSCGDITNGIYELARYGAQVINMSFGSPEPCVTELIAVEQVIGDGVIVVAAAGNDFEDGNLPQYPAAYPHVLSVAATTFAGDAAWFSNANFAIDVAAPGVGVPVALPLAWDVEDGVRDGMTLADGTSFAAPIVAGAAAWLRSARPALDGSQLADTLRFSAKDLGPEGWDPNFGYGSVDMAAALDAAAPPRDPLEPNDDIAWVDGTYFKRADPPIYTGRSRAIGAGVDLVEDPADVYRIRMPGRSSLVATLRPRRGGDADLIAFHDGATAVSRRRGRVDGSFRTHGPDRVYLINRGRRAVSGYLAVISQELNGVIDARYSLRVTRTYYGR